jgi:uncharacterized protein YqcC (DUF446 family)
LRLLKLLRLKTDGRFRLAEMKRKLDSFSDPDLEAWVFTQRLAPAVASALSVPTQHAPAPAAQSTLAKPATNAFTFAETWQRIRLLPRLELLVSSDASLGVRGIAQKIYEDCLASV